MTVDDNATPRVQIDRTGRGAPRHRWPDGARKFRRGADDPRELTDARDHPHHPDELRETLMHVSAAMGDISGALLAMTPGVLSARTVALDGNGTAAGQERLPYRALAVSSYSARLLTIAAAPLAGSAPGPGPGVSQVQPGGFRVMNASAYAWSIYGGAPGELVTVEAFSRPQPPNADTGTLVTSTAAPLAPQAALVNFGSATAPAANQTIAVITAPAPGLYSVEVLAELSGTITAAEQDNLNLVVNAVNLSRIPLFAGAAAGGIPETVGPFNLTVAGGNIAVQARAAGGVAAVYSVFVTATRIA
jgi:hypothetical protein